MCAAPAFLNASAVPRCSAVLSPQIRALSNPVVPLFLNGALEIASESRRDAAERISGRPLEGKDTVEVCVHQQKIPAEKKHRKMKKVSNFPLRRRTDAAAQHRTRATVPKDAGIPAAIAVSIPAERENDILTITAKYS